MLKADVKLLKLINFQYLIHLFNFCNFQLISGFSDIEFNVKPIPAHKIHLPGHRIEHAERNTSKEYTYWKEMELNFIEWPGNITKLEIENPLLTWKKKRAKLIQCPCSIPLGMDFKAYAYKYVHLTWGSFRMTTSYCPPFKIPRNILKHNLPSSSSSHGHRHKLSPFISASDFEFVSNALLVILESQFILRIGDLEASHRREGSPILDPSNLSYTLANGLTSPVTKLVTQNCCKNRLTTTCLHGDTVMAFNEHFLGMTIFISSDAGMNFRQLSLMSLNSPFLHSSLVFPNIDVIVAIHGNKTSAAISRYSLATGQRLASNKQSNVTVLRVKGSVQAKQIGEENSLVIWDECKVWYSSNTGLNLSEALFYIHNNIQEDINKKIPKKKNAKSTNKHRIIRKYCFLGGVSGFAHDITTGKIGILDSLNNFFYGIDTKTSRFPLIGGNMDMSLLMTGKEASVVPFFDFNNRPKLMYPPRYLWSDDEAYKDKNYKKRLGMRLFPRSVFHSDFMPPFFEENIPKRYKRVYGLKKCQTSSIIADSSLTQKPKIYYANQNSAFNITIEFKSFNNDSNQLHIESKFYAKYLRIVLIQLDFMRLGTKEYFYFKYQVAIFPKPLAFSGGLFRLNFYTQKSVRCNHQPQLTVWVKVTSEYQEDERREPNTFTSDPEPVEKLRNFLNASRSMKMAHGMNPMSVNQCQRKS